MASISGSRRKKIHKQINSLISDSVQSKLQLKRIKLDTFIGMGFSNVIAFFIMLTTASVLFTNHITNIETSAQAAEALRPIAGGFAFILFAGGVIGTGLLSIPVLAGTVGYAIAETFKWPQGMELKFAFARGVYTTIGIATIGGVILGFTHIDPIKALYFSAVVNGVISVHRKTSLFRSYHYPQV